MNSIPGREPRPDRSRYQSTQRNPQKGLLLGTDFRHAVEFSRNGRATTPAPAGFVDGGGPTLPRVRAAPPKGTPRRAARPARRIEKTTCPRRPCQTSTTVTPDTVPYRAEHLPDTW